VTQGSAAGAGRSTAIVLFTDLVGSTELRSRLGEDAAEELRRDHDRLIAGAVEANRGRLVKHLGDGVMATFIGASDALAAAVAMQQDLDRHNRSGTSDAPLAVRIGISAGDVTLEGEDCFGTPVIEAARLCAAAGGGRILRADLGELLIPEGVRDVVGRRLSHLAKSTNELLAIAAVVGLEFEPAVVERAGGVGEDQLPALAHHWARAAAPAADSLRAIDYATRAGDRAVSQLAPDEAVSYYRQALELVDVAEAEPAEGLQLRLLIALGEAQRQAGDPAHRETLLSAAHLAADKGDAAALARAALANTRAIFSSTVGEVDDDRVASIEAALDAIGDDAPTRARLLAALGQEIIFAGDRERIRAHSSRVRANQVGAPIRSWVAVASAKRRSASSKSPEVEARMAR
jgi:class 3 adenylate cyclase